MSKRILCYLVLPALLVGAGWRVIQQYRAAAIFEADPGIEGARAAIEWDPEGWEYHHRLGVLYDLRSGIPPEFSLQRLRKAIELNPYDWRAHLDLANAAERAGRVKEADEAFRCAIALNPRSAPFRWRAANFYLRHGRMDESRHQADELLQVDGSYRPAWVLLLDRIGAPASMIERQSPRDKTWRLKLLRALVKRRVEANYESELLNIQAQWESLLSSPEKVTLEETAFYINDLAMRGDGAGARREMIRVAERAGAGEQDFIEGKEAVWNGGFETPFSGIVMDWSVGRAKDFSYRLSPGEGLGGSQALRIEFPGRENLDFKGIRQLVSVEPGATYTLSAWIKTRELSTDQGPFLQVVDPVTGVTLAETDSVMGAVDWTELSCQVRVPTDTKFLALQVRRRPSRRIDNLLRGVVWLDSVSLRVAPGNAGQPAAGKAEPTAETRG